MDKNTVLSQFLQPIFSKKFQQIISESGVDKYVKKLEATKLIQIMSYAILYELDSLREISLRLTDNQISQIIELSSISHSQISRRFKCLMPEMLDYLFKEATLQLNRETDFHQFNNRLGRLQIIDSTTISLCLSKSPWAVFRKTKSGVKVHLRLKFCDEITAPGQIVITPAKVADRRELDNLVVEDPDALHVFDRGYIDYKKFDQFCDEGIRFVTRLKDNAIVEIVSTKFVSTGPILRECLVYLGEGNRKMKHLLRLIEVLDDQGRLIRILTNDMLTSTENISEIYRKRWQIELFFKWVKQHLTIKHLFGTSQRAVETQIYLVFIIFCLLQLLRLKTNFKKSLLDLTRILKICLFKTFTDFIKMLHRNPIRTSKGRRRIDYETIYRMTERQVIIDLDAGHLNDLTYDPVIL